MPNSFHPGSPQVSPRTLKLHPSASPARRTCSLSKNRIPSRTGTSVHLQPCRHRQDPSTTATAGLGNRRPGEVNGEADVTFPGIDGEMRDASGCNVDDFGIEFG